MSVAESHLIRWTFASYTWSLDLIIKRPLACDVFLFLFWKARASVYVQWGKAMPGLSSVINTTTRVSPCSVIHLLMVGYFDANSSTTMHNCMFCQLLKINFTLNRKMMTCKKNKNNKKPFIFSYIFIIYLDRQKRFSQFCHQLLSPAELSDS